jgi:hypothetical protein
MPQGSEEGIRSYLGRSPDVWNIKEKSAEVVVVDSNEPKALRRTHNSMKDQTLSCSKCCREIINLTDSLRLKISPMINGTEKQNVIND